MRTTLVILGILLAPMCVRAQLVVDGGADPVITPANDVDTLKAQVTELVAEKQATATKQVAITEWANTKGEDRRKGMLAEWCRANIDACAAGLCGPALEMATEFVQQQEQP